MLPPTAQILPLLLLVAAGWARALPAPAAFPPDGIRPKDAPLFLLFIGLVLPIANSARNPNGCLFPVTWFACTKSCEFDCGQVKALYDMGHELGVHSQHHSNLRSASKKKIRSEIMGGARDEAALPEDIAACGVPREAVQGFRTPFLSDKPEVREVLHENGFRYDSTIGAKGGANRVWPGVMDNGVGFDCDVGGQKCDNDESYPGLWEAPLYETADRNLMDVCTDENSGSPRSGCSAYSQLKSAFDASYYGNRGPVSIGIHSPYLTHSAYVKDLKKFFKYATSKKDVWAVTMSQLLDWMTSPVPAKKMTKFMNKYTCVK